MSIDTPESIIAASAVLLAASSLAVGARFYARFINVNAKISFDDLVQPVSLILFAGLCGTAISAVRERALAYPSVDGFRSADPNRGLRLKYMLSLNLLVLPTLALSKLAALWLYRRIFCVETRGRLYVTIWVLMVATVVWALGSFLAIILQCGSRLWAWVGNDIAVLLQYCNNGWVDFWAPLVIVIIDLILDTLILCVPIPSIWALKLSTKRKLALTLIFMFALISYGVVVWRLASYIQIIQEFYRQESQDPALTNTRIIWGYIMESGASIIAVNLPPLGTLSTHFNLQGRFSSLRSLMKGSSGGHSTSAIGEGVQKKASSTESDRTPHNVSQDSVDRHYA